MNKLFCSRTMKRLFTDLVEPMKFLPLAEIKYFIEMLDEPSGYSMVNFLRLKNEATETVISMVGDYENFCGNYAESTSAVEPHKVRHLRSDGGPGYVDTKF